MNHEEAVIRAFVTPAKRRSLIERFGNPKTRLKARAKLAHFADLDSRYARRVPHDKQNATAIRKLLQSRGAPLRCYVISENAELDQREMPLSEALDAVVAAGFGTFISCLPGRLGYFEGEEPGERYVLERGAV